MLTACISVLPLLTLHMTSIGLTFADVAQVYLFMPVASFLGPPVIGEDGEQGSAAGAGWGRRVSSGDVIC